MIVNAVNLVGWQQLAKTSSFARSSFYCDSWSLALAFRIVGITDYFRLPGSSLANYLKKLDPTDCAFLTPSKLRLGRGSNQYVLPKLTEEEPDFQKIASLCSGRRFLIIGISSPAQNLLAEKIASHNPEITIFCLGAMIYQFSEGKDSLVAMSWLSLFRIEFLHHLISSPSRTVQKIKIILIQFWKILSSKSNRKEFTLYAQRFQRSKNVPPSDLIHI